jgi:hypothetical protein
LLRPGLAPQSALGSLPSVALSSAVVRTSVPKRVHSENDGTAEHVVLASAISILVGMLSGGLRSGKFSGGEGAEVEPPPKLRD